MSKGPTRQREAQISQRRKDRALWLDLLLDAWNQFAIRSEDGKRWYGHLSLLEDIESCLRREGLIDKDGLPVKKGGNR